jgi:hypothetical protein
VRQIINTAVAQQHVLQAHHVPLCHTPHPKHGFFMSLLTFAEVLAENRTAATVGGKALHLAEMAASAAASTNFSFHVPTGVVLTTTAYVSHITNAGVDQAAILDGSLPLADVRAALESTAPEASLVAALDVFLDTCAWGASGLDSLCATAAVQAPRGDQSPPQSTTAAAFSAPSCRESLA